MRELTKAHLTTEEHLNSTLVAKREELAIKQARLKRIFDEAGSNRDLSRITSLQGTNEQKRQGMIRLNDELNMLAEEVNSLAVGAMLNDPVSDFPFPGGASEGVK